MTQLLVSWQEERITKLSAEYKFNPNPKSI